MRAIVIGLGKWGALLAEKMIRKSNSVLWRDAGYVELIRGEKVSLMRDSKVITLKTGEKKKVEAGKWILSVGDIPLSEVSVEKDRVTSIDLSLLLSDRRRVGKIEEFSLLGLILGTLLGFLKNQGLQILGPSTIQIVLKELIITSAIGSVLLLFNKYLVKILEAVKLNLKIRDARALRLLTAYAVISSAYLLAYYSKFKLTVAGYAIALGMTFGLVGYLLEENIPITIIELPPVRSRKSGILEQQKISIYTIMAMSLSSLALMSSINPGEPLNYLALLSIAVATLAGLAGAFASVFIKTKQDSLEILGLVLGTTSYLTTLVILTSQLNINNFYLPLLASSLSSIILPNLMKIVTKALISPFSVKPICDHEPEYKGAHLIGLIFTDDNAQRDFFTCLREQEREISEFTGKKVNLVHFIRGMTYNEYLEEMTVPIRKTLSRIKEWVMAACNDTLDYIIVLYDSECCAIEPLVRALERVDLPKLYVLLVREWDSHKKFMKGLENSPVLITEIGLFISPNVSIQDTFDEYSNEVLSSLLVLTEIGGPGIKSTVGGDVTHLQAALEGMNVECCQQRKGKAKRTLSTVSRIVIPECDDDLEESIRLGFYNLFDKFLADLDFDRLGRPSDRIKGLVVLKGPPKMMLQQAILSELKKSVTKDIVGVLDVTDEGKKELEIVLLISGLEEADFINWRKAGGGENETPLDFSRGIFEDSSTNSQSNGDLEDLDKIIGNSTELEDELEALVVGVKDI